MREAGLSFSIVANYVIVLLACFPDHEWVLISHAYRHGKLFPILLVTSTWLFESFCPSFFDFVEKQNCSGKKKSHVFLTKVCLKIWPVLCSGSISRPSQFLSFVVTTIITFFIYWQNTFLCSGVFVLFLLCFSSEECVFIRAYHQKNWNNSTNYKVSCSNFTLVLLLSVILRASLMRLNIFQMNCSFLF